MSVTWVDGTGGGILEKGDLSLWLSDREVRSLVDQLARHYEIAEFTLRGQDDS